MPADHPEYLPLYRALVEYARDLLGVVDRVGGLRFLSPASRSVLGYPPSRLIGKNLVDWTHPEDRDALRNWIELASRRMGEAESCSLRIGEPGRWRMVEMTGVGVMEDPTTQSVVFSATDVTERVQAARAMKANEQKFRGAFDFAPIGKALMTPDGTLTEANRALADMLGVWVSELIGQRFVSFIEPDDVAEFEKCARLLVQDPESTHELEVRIAIARGQERWGWVSVSALTGEAHQLESLILQVQDVTARHQAESALRSSNEDLRRSNEELKRFAFMASHDLREPLRGIGGSIQLLARRNKDVLGESGNELAKTAIDGVKKLQAQLNQLLEYAEQMRGEDLDSEPVLMQNVIQHVLQDLSGKIEESGAFTEVGNMPTVLGDPDQLQQIFFHLIDNAIKFREPLRPCRIKVEAQWQKKLWQFTVADNGIGIDPEHHDQIFDVFRRLHAGEQYEGTGMGLATVRKIVEHHGGRIRVESVLGEGARFIFTLPPE